MAEKTDESKGKPEPKAKTEVATPLQVEINFPAISDLKQAIGTDSDGNLLIAIQFKAKVDQFEVFRLVNLLKQPHEALYCIIGSKQSAMDFKFDAKELRFDIFQAQKQIEAGAKKSKSQVINVPTAETPPVAQVTLFDTPAVKIHAVTFNHIQDEPKPYGVAIDYVADGTGEIHTVAGRGMNPTEAVVSGLSRILPGDLKEPFEFMAELEQLEPSPEGYKLIRVLQVGSFDDEPGDEGGKQKKTKGE
jgi:hypothetical protein